MNEFNIRYRKSLNTGSYIENQVKISAVVTNFEKILEVNIFPSWNFIKL